LLHNATPLVRQGAAVFQAKQCRNCHTIGGSGGERGPDLDYVATRMTVDQMRFKVVTGGGNMPAYGKNLSPPEIEALVSFLETLHPANEPPAYDPSRRELGNALPAGNSAAPAHPSSDPTAIP
jgi:ubiquinol-cytochrome c reductase cytochrome b subunit